MTVLVRQLEKMLDEIVLFGTELNNFGGKKPGEKKDRLLVVCLL